MVEGQLKLRRWALPLPVAAVACQWLLLFVFLFFLFFAFWKWVFISAIAIPRFLPPWCSWWWWFGAWQLRNLLLDHDTTIMVVVEHKGSVKGNVFLTSPNRGLRFDVSNNVFFKF